MKYRVYTEKEGIRFYYVGYLPNGGGLILSEEAKEAFQFESKQNAENLMNADERFSSKAGAKLEPIQ